MANRRCSAAALVCAGALAASSMAMAQEAGHTVTKDAVTIEIGVHHAVVLNVTNAFGEVSVGEPNIADLATLSDKAIYLLGKTPGTTSVTLLNTDGSFAGYKVIVAHPIDAELAFAASALPNVTLTRDALTVTAMGCMSDNLEREAMAQMSKALTDKSYTVLSAVGAC